MVRTRPQPLIVCTLIAWMVTLACGQAGATTYHVSPRGSDTPPYDSYATAAHGVADAVFLTTGHGDTVLIHTGEYNIDTTIDVPLGVTLAGVGRDSVSLVWQAREQEGRLWLFRVLGDTEIWGITFYNPYGLSQPASSGVYQSVSTGWLKIHHCRFTKTGAYSSSSADREFFENIHDVWTSRGYMVSGGGHAWIHHNTFLGAYRENGDGLRAAGSDLLVEHNVFDFSLTAGLGRPVSVDRYPIHAIVRNNLIIGGQWAIWWQETSGMIENNTIIRPSRSEGGLQIFQDLEDTLLIRNNLFLDFVGLPAVSRSEDDFPMTGPVTLVHNAYWPPVDSFYMAHRYEDPSVVHVIDSGNFNGFPMLTDDSLYRLQMASPLIDAGDRSVLDVDGSRSDVGWTGGPEGISYPYPDLAPHSPELLWPEGESTRVMVTWNRRPEADLAGYHLYRGTSRGFTDPLPLPSPIAELGDGDTSYTEILPREPDTVYYAVTAFDTVGLASDPSEERAYAISRGTNRPPELPPLDWRVIVEGGSLELELVATDADDDSLFFVVGSLPEHAQFTDHGDRTATFVFHPDYTQAGRYEIDIVVSDGMYADSSLILVQVNARNGPPQFTPIDAQTVLETEELTVGVTASDPDGDSVILSAEDVPVNGTFEDHGDGSGTFAFSPDTTQAGVYTVRLIASDGERADTLELPVTVTEPGSPSLPRTPRIVRSYPNPFNSAILIEVYIPDMGASLAPVELSVYDTIGRHVGVIFRGELAPGTHALPWDGTANGGQSLASGVYFVRLKVWSRVFGSGHKIVLLK